MSKKRTDNDSKKKMVRPLYALSKKEHQFLEQGSMGRMHLGLWFDKYCDQWAPDWTMKEQKSNWIEGIVERSTCDHLDYITKYVNRLQKIVSDRQGQTLRLQTTSRLITGMGLSNPVENGLLFHPTLGIPYLPGSSVKGVVRAWAQEVGVEEEVLAHIFGYDARLPLEKDAYSSNERSVGSWIFFDALPVKNPELEMDVMTPHFGPYYADPANNPPHDGYEPVPIPFLTVKQGTEFQFAFAPRVRGKEGAGEAEKITHWLVEAIHWAGAGAKTAVGYGRFGRVTTQ